MNTYQKGFSLLNSSQKREILILSILLLLGVLFEMFGLGILIPAIGLLVEPNSILKYVPQNFVNSNPIDNKSFIYFGLSLIVLVYVLKTLYLLYITWRQNKFTSLLSAQLSEKLFSGYLGLPYKYHLDRNSSIPLSIIQNEISSFSSVTQAIIQLFTELSVLVGVLITLFWVFPMGTMFLIAFFGLSVFLFYNFSKKKLNSWGGERHNLLVNANKNLIQGFGGIKDLKIYNRESYFLNKYKKANDLSAQIFIKVNTLNYFPRYYLELLAVSGLMGLIFMMILQNQSLSLILPSLGIFVAAAFRMIPSVNRIMISMQQIKFADITFEKLYNEFQLINSNNQPIQKDKILGNSSIEIISVNKLVFGYSTAKRIINNISFEISRGEVIGVIGSSGSGKSTLIDLMLGLLTPDAGEILVDSTSIYNNLKNWHKIIGYVPQTIFLTDDTLLNNIAFGIEEKDIDYDRANKAIISAQLEQFVSSLPDGIDTSVGERGVKISGGQRQRIGIARALYHNPEILILDEATSALDNETESEVMESIYKMSGKLTIIIIAHRLSTLLKCDRIIELQNGVIIKDAKPHLIIK